MFLVHKIRKLGKVYNLGAEAIPSEVLHGGLDGTRLLGPARDPHVVLRVYEEHGVLGLSHGFKEDVLDLPKMEKRREL